MKTLSIETQDNALIFKTDDLDFIKVFEAIVADGGLSATLAGQPGILTASKVDDAYILSF